MAKLRLPKKDDPVSGNTKKFDLPNTDAASGTTKVLPLHLPVEGPGESPFSFSLSAPARTSAGVYSGDTLIRTLWSGLEKDAGTHSVAEVWDGKDDEENEVPNGDYTIRVRTNDFTYEAEGTVGNTSAEKSGPTVYHSGEHIMAMTICDGFAYFGCGYVEGRGGHFKFALNDPQRRILLSLYPNHGQVVRYLDHDADKVYWCGEFPRPTGDDGSDFGITATVRGTDAAATLAGGVSKFVPGSPAGTTYSSAVFHRDEPIYGFAVQKSGNFYAFALRDANVLRIIDKRDGTTQDVTLNKARDIRFSGDDNFLWITTSTNTVAKYSINSSGVVNTTPVLTLSGLVNPNGISIAPDGTVAVLDGPNKHQIRFFHPTSGAEGNPLGQENGYANSPEVSDDKFYFVNTKKLDKATPEEIGYGSCIPYLCHQPDGKLWVGDVGNLRSQLFNTNLTWANTIQFVGFHYIMQVDANNPNRVFLLYLEFEIDYSKSLQPDNGSWKLKRNWAYNAKTVLTIPPGPGNPTGNPTGIDDKYFRLRDVTTLPQNSRTYCLQRAGATNTMVLCELSPTGLRNTGVTFSTLLHHLYADGSIWSVETYDVGQQAVFKRRAITGFDGSNNPTYGSAIIIQTSPVLTGKDAMPSGTRRNQVSASGRLITFNPGGETETNNKNNGYHLGALVGNQWLWKASYSTPMDYSGDYPPDGWFENGNRNNTNSGGNIMQCVGPHIFFGTHLEGWKGGQTNKYNHFYEDGLFLGQYGVAQPKSDESDYEEAPAGMAGNATNGTWVAVGDVIHHQHCDEFLRGGSLRWKISNLSSMQVFNFAFTKSGSITLPPKLGIDLMAGLPYNDVVTDGLAGWSRSPATEGPQGNLTRWLVRTSRLSYHKNRRDIYIESRANATGLTQTVSRSLGGPHNLTTWSLEGGAAWPEISEQQLNCFDILDNAGRVIVRVRREWLNSSSLRIQANGTTLVTGTNNTMKYLVRYLTPFLIRRSGSNILVTYGGVTISVAAFDGLADLSKPDQLKVTFQNTSGTYGHVVGLSDLRFFTE